MTISTKSIAQLVALEDGDQAYYDRTESHWDWPGGASGPTAGVGYDCGYVTTEECRTDWTGIVSDATVAAMVRGVGLTGDAAHQWVQQHRAEITVTWAQALQEFTEREVPKWELRMSSALPNWKLLSPDSAGALLSLGYNRGTAGFTSTLPRFREMAMIRDYMQRGLWAYIPHEITNMIRLWPNMPSLRRRRVIEAQLFAEGLPECQPLQSTTSTFSSVPPSSSAPGSDTEPSSSTT